MAGRERMRPAGLALLAGCGVLVFLAEGFHGIALWNLLPLFMAALALVRGAGAVGTSWPAVAFAVVAALAVALVHLAWVFDWGGTQTGSSTAGLIFLFSPILALLLGGFGWVAAMIAWRFASGRPRC